MTGNAKDPVAWSLSCGICQTEETVTATLLPGMGSAYLWDFTPSQYFLVRKTTDEATPEIVSARCHTCTRQARIAEMPAAP
jgi:hypothetical protein